MLINIDGATTINTAHMREFERLEDDKVIVTWSDGTSRVFANAGGAFARLTEHREPIKIPAVQPGYAVVEAWSESGRIVCGDAEPVLYFELVNEGAVDGASVSAVTSSGRALHLSSTQVALIHPTSCVFHSEGRCRDVEAWKKHLEDRLSAEAEEPTAA